MINDVIESDVLKERPFKEKRRNQIIEAAKILFVEKGLMATTMSDIAEKINIGRRTLYRYYQSKEELAFEIELKLFEDYFEEQGRIIESLSGTGLEKIETFLIKQNELIKENAMMINFTAEFDHYFRGVFPYIELANRFNALIMANNGNISVIIEEGIKDGSIREDIDVYKTAMTIENVMLSLSQRILSIGKRLDMEQQLDSWEMIDAQVALYIQALKK